MDTSRQSMGDAMDEAEFKSWVDKQRADVERYLTRHGIINPNVGPWPAFEVAPYFAIWAVESQKTPGKIGWWAFSGDCPTDYVSEDGKCHPRNALKILLNNWSSWVPALKQGKQPSNTRFSDDNLPILGELLEKRVAILSKWLDDDSLWDDR